MSTLNNIMSYFTLLDFVLFCNKLTLSDSPVESLFEFMAE